jgi:hypothetical protein
MPLRARAIDCIPSLLQPESTAPIATTKAARRSNLL